MGVEILADAALAPAVEFAPLLDAPSAVVEVRKVVQAVAVRIEEGRGEHVAPAAGFAACSLRRVSFPGAMRTRASSRRSPTGTCRRRRFAGPWRQARVNSKAKKNYRALSPVGVGAGRLREVQQISLAASAATAMVSSSTSSECSHDMNHAPRSSARTPRFSMAWQNCAYSGLSIAARSR